VISRSASSLEQALGKGRAFTGTDEEAWLRPKAFDPASSDNLGAVIRKREQRKFD
jgi:hypothetical protein